MGHRKPAAISAPAIALHRSDRVPSGSDRLLEFALPGFRHRHSVRLCLDILNRHRHLEIALGPGGDHIRHIVVWNARTNLSSLAKHPACLSFQMTKANLYAFQFTDSN